MTGVLQAVVTSRSDHFGPQCRPSERHLACLAEYQETTSNWSIISLSSCSSIWQCHLLAAVWLRDSVHNAPAQAGALHAQVPRSPTKRRNVIFRLLGPGLVTGAADDDPSGIATYSQAGARPGSQLFGLSPRDLRRPPLHRGTVALKCTSAVMRRRSVATAEKRQ